jgi:flagellar basal-body rod modification protein FlgD
VLVPGAELSPREGADVPFAVELPAAAGSVKVSITNGAGETVRTFDLGALQQGVKTLAWDGKSDNGTPVADGVYTLQVEASAGGDKAAAGTLTYAKVASVAQGAYGVSLDLDSGKKSELGQVRLIL